MKDLILEVLREHPEGIEHMKLFHEVSERFSFLDAYHNAFAELHHSGAMTIYDSLKVGHLMSKLATDETT